MDPRALKLAQVLIDYSLRVKKGDHVVIAVSDFTALDVFRECYRLCLEREAEVLLDMLGMALYGSRCDTGGLFTTYLEHASATQLKKPAPLLRETVDWGEKFLLLSSVHNRNYLCNQDAKRLMLARNAYNDVFKAVMNKDRIVTYFPTEGTAQNARMSLEQFTNYYYSAVLVDYEKMGKRIKLVQDILDKGKVVRIIATNTDLTLGIAGRLAAGAEPGRRNIPDGECFIAPTDTETEGYISFEYPQVKDGNEMKGMQLTFQKGEVVAASAESGIEFLEAAFADHPNNRRLGELGIGMNPLIQSYIQDTIFDEKILGTIHIALGLSYNYKRGGGTNKGTIHWDLMKDPRHKGSLLTVDGRALIKDGILQV